MTRPKPIEAKPKRTRTRAPNNRTTTGFRISDDLWAVLKPLLPEHVNPHRFGGGRPREDDRGCADAIFYVLRTGRQWQALDARPNYAPFDRTRPLPGLGGGGCVSAALASGRRAL